MVHRGEEIEVECNAMFLGKLRAQKDSEIVVGIFMGHVNINLRNIMPLNEYIQCKFIYKTVS
jgi:hypothetical protein